MAAAAVDSPAIWLGWVAHGDKRAHTAPTGDHRQPRHADPQGPHRESALRGRGRRRAPTLMGNHGGLAGAYGVSESGRQVAGFLEAGVLLLPQGPVDNGLA